MDAASTLGMFFFWPFAVAQYPILGCGIGFIVGWLVDRLVARR